MSTSDLHALASRLTGASVIVLGDVMLDRYVVGSAARVSPEAPIPVVRAAREHTSLGGAANVARNVASLGGTAHLVGVVGEDGAAHTMRTLIEHEARLEASLIPDPSRPTTLKTRFVAQGQQLLRVDHEVTGAVGESVPDRLLAKVQEGLGKASVLVLSDYAKGVLGAAMPEKALALARATGATTIVDPKRRDLTCYAGATVITPNANEAAEATGIACEDDAGVVAAARRIAAVVGCRHVVVTRGARGMTIYSPAASEIVHIPTLARAVHDVSGAGDTVVATLALALARGAPIESACRLANVAAGLAVSKPGTTAVGADELIAATRESAHRAWDEKTVGLETAARIAADWRAAGQRVVVANGCFDLLHPGHVRLLGAARAQGDRLIVAINSDASTRRLKGAGRPVQPEAARALVIAALAAVDLVVIFEEDTPIRVIERVSPDVLVKGADYTEAQVVGGDIVRARGGRVHLVPLEAGHSTTATIARAGLRPATRG